MHSGPLQHSKIIGFDFQIIGQHASAEQDNTFEIARNIVDYIARGEYDYTLRDIARKMAPEQILGLTWWNYETLQVIKNPERLPCDVNKLPFPAWPVILSFSRPPK